MNTLEKRQGKKFFLIMGFYLFIYIFFTLQYCIGFGGKWEGCSGWKKGFLNIMILGIDTGIW